MRSQPLSTLYSFPVVIVAKSEVSARALHAEARKRLEADAGVLNGGMVCDPMEHGCIGDKLVEYRRLQAQVLKLIDNGMLDRLLANDPPAFRELVRTTAIISQMEAPPPRATLPPTKPQIPEPEPVHAHKPADKAA